MTVRLVFVHSPLLGPESWVPVSQEMVARGWAVAVAELRDGGQTPYWRQHVDSVAGGLRTDRDGVVLIAHSGAGPLLAAVAYELRERALALLFVDAGLPEDGASRLAMLRTEMDDTFADAFEAHLRSGGRYPQWRENDLASVVESQSARTAILALQRPRPLDFWTEPIPAPTDWAALPCAYLRLSDGYAISARRADEMGWPLIERASNHFAILSEPALVAADLEALLARVGSNVHVEWRLAVVRETTSHCFLGRVVLAWPTANGLAPAADNDPVRCAVSAAGVWDAAKYPRIRRLTMPHPPAIG